MLPRAISLCSKFHVNDEELSTLHNSAFGLTRLVIPWAERLSRFSVSWVGAFDGSKLVGFVHAIWDGGQHAFLLDLMVDQAYQRRGVGRALVAQIIADVRDSGCEWLHVDYEPRLKGFYEGACGFGSTEAGLFNFVDDVLSIGRSIGSDRDSKSVKLMVELCQVPS